VIGRESQRAVEGAVVAIEGTNVSATTNRGGHFRLTGVTVGTATLVVKAEGFLDMSIPGVQVGTQESAPVSIELEVVPNYMEQVQVTATKTQLAVGDVAAQTNTVNRATIENRGDQSLVQAIAHVPGAIVSTQLGIFESVMLRGLPRGDPEFTNTLLMI